jgi:hypothetical protein
MFVAEWCVIEVAAVWFRQMKTLSLEMWYSFAIRSCSGVSQYANAINPPTVTTPQKNSCLNNAFVLSQCV